MKFIALSLAFFSITAFAATKRFDIKSQIFINGKLISAPQIIIAPNKTGNISSTNKDNSESISLELVASDIGQGREGILMDFTVSYMNEQKKIAVSKAKIISRSGQEAEIALDEKHGDKITLKVVATRIE